MLKRGMDQINKFLPFPDKFKFGTAVAPFQVEGNTGIRNSDWDTFLKNNPDIITPGQVGPEWWKEGVAESEIDLTASFGVKIQRLGLEWARIEPKEGKISQA